MTPRRFAIALGFALVALGAAPSCKPAPQSFKELCAVHNRATPGVKLRGQFLGSKGDMIYECDRAGGKFRAQPARGRGCPLTLYPNDEGKLGSVDVFFAEGKGPNQIQPIPERFDWNKDIHVAAAGGSVELGDVVEVTGTLDTMYGDCTMRDVTSIVLVEDNYGPGAKR